VEARGIEPLTNPLRKPRLLNRAAHKDLAARLAGGGTIAEAAKVAGVDERTVYKWKADDPAFGQRVAELRARRWFRRRWAG
jgi:hypothetical protein